MTLRAEETILNETSTWQISCFTQIILKMYYLSFLVGDCPLYKKDFEHLLVSKHHILNTSKLFHIDYPVRSMQHQIGTCW